MNKLRWWCITASVCAVAWWQLAPNQQPANQSLQSEARVVSVKAPHEAQDKVVLEAASISSELEGLIMPYQLTVDEHGDLVISSDLKEFFEFYLSAHDVRDFDAKLNIVKAQLANTLKQPALNQALGIFDQYIQVKRALAEQEQFQSNGTYSLTELLQAKIALIQSYMGLEVYTVFYEEEHQYLAYLLDVKENDNEANTINDVDFINTSQQHIELHAVSASSNTQTEALQSVQQQYGYEVAQRYEKVLELRQAFIQRIDQFTQQRNEILATSGVSEESKSQQIEQLLNSQFDELERIRVRTRLSQ